MFGNFLGGGGLGFYGGFSFGGGFDSNKESNRCKLCKESGSMFGSFGFMKNNRNDFEGEETITGCCKSIVHERCYNMCKGYLGKCVLCKKENISPVGRFGIFLVPQCCGGIKLEVMEDDYYEAEKKANLFENIFNKLEYERYEEQLENAKENEIDKVERPTTHMFLPKYGDRAGMYAMNISKYKYFANEINKLLGCPNFNPENMDITSKGTETSKIVNNDNIVVEAEKIDKKTLNKTNYKFVLYLFQNGFEFVKVSDKPNTDEIYKDYIFSFTGEDDEYKFDLWLKRVIELAEEYPDFYLVCKIIPSDLSIPGDERLICEFQEKTMLIKLENLTKFLYEPESEQNSEFEEPEDSEERKKYDEKFYEICDDESIPYEQKEKMMDELTEKYEIGKFIRNKRSDLDRSYKYTKEKIEQLNTDKEYVIERTKKYDDLSREELLEKIKKLKIQKIKTRTLLNHAQDIIRYLDT